MAERIKIVTFSEKTLSRFLVENSKQERIQALTDLSEDSLVVLIRVVPRV
ncbi:hypothetical protein LM13656_130170 [Listeria monocytogenes]|nr:hypothetical protein LM1000505_130168 [Listeria monocytogenes]CUK32556.1 hypothetical protein LM13656_130170 [Listeria monocytogenes]CUK43343.1 hypothetical protein LM500190_140285 [Listeria monocytogenes]CUL13554.1 hypothetical protein LM701337_90171 [Listeria monocytogenes]CUL18355.1 hypothetical protein LM700948_100171 [Listeria monocytogenes]